MYCDDSADGQGLSKHDGLQLRISCHYGSDLSGGIIRRGVPSGWYYTGIFKRNARTYQCFKVPGKAKSEDLSCLKGIFDHRYLDERMDNFIDSMDKNQEGVGGIEEYINEDEIDLHVHKKILEMAPDIFTSLGILGTFIGLVWGLKSFEPSSYETMTMSVSTLVDGIKVAFLTSIYGIAFALIYSSGMKSVYAGMDEKLQGFLEKFHMYVLPAAESESRNLMLASQKVQTKAMKQMAEQLTSQMAESFEKAINPTFEKMNESLEILTESVTKCQQDVVQEILRSFLREMNSSFKLQFKDFNESLVQLKKAQKRIQITLQISTRQ